MRMDGVWRWCRVQLVGWLTAPGMLWVTVCSAFCNSGWQATLSSPPSLRLRFAERAPRLCVQRAGCPHERSKCHHPHSGRAAHARVGGLLGLPCGVQHPDL